MDFGGLGLYTAMFQSVWFVITILMLAVLIALYRCTRASGLLWLLAGLVWWPIAMRVMYLLLPVWINHHFTDSNLDATIMVSASAFDSIGQAILLLIAAMRLLQDFRLGVNRPGNKNGAA